MPPSARRRFLLIANPKAGRLGRRLLEPTVGALLRGGAVVTRAHADSIAEVHRVIAAAVHENSCDAVLVAGGDGSFRSAATALLGVDMPIGLIPLGTGNVLAHELQLPAECDALAWILRQGPTAALKAAQANGAPFFLWAGAGFDGAVISRLNQTLKQRLGKGAYVPAVVRTLAAALPDLAVTVDGQSYRATWVIVSNARLYGGRFVLVPHTHALDEGLFALLFQARDRRALIRQLFALARGQLPSQPDVLILPCRHVAVRSAGTVAVEIDGDEAGHLPLEITATHRHVHVIVPPDGRDVVRD